VEKLAADGQNIIWARGQADMQGALQLMIARALDSGMDRETVAEAAVSALMICALSASHVAADAPRVGAWLLLSAALEVLQGYQVDPNPIEAHLPIQDDGARA
jgi:hypothetical protein